MDLLEQANSSGYTMSFKQSNAMGQVAEQAFCDLLTKAGLAHEQSQKKEELIRFDVRIYFPDAPPLLVEIKFDAKSNVTGNLAIEVWNPHKNKPSGITATEAHLWVFALSATTVYVIRTAELKLILSEVEPYKVIAKGGDSNATLHLYKKEQILPLCRRVDMLCPADFRTYLEHENRCQQHFLSKLSLPSLDTTIPEVPESTLSSKTDDSLVPW